MKIFFAILLSAASLLADGGVVILSGKTANEILTVFATPEPVRAGPTDFSVLVQDMKENPLLGGQVSLAFTNGDDRVTAAATHAQATDKLLFSATLDLPHPGKWLLRVEYKTATEIGELTGSVSVGARQPPWLAFWPYFAAVPVIVLLFFLNQKLKRQRQSRRL